MPLSDPNQTLSPVACGLAGEVVRRFGVVRFRVAGCSMLPLVAPGDVLVVHRRSAREIMPGDIAVFTRHQRLFAHRVVGRISAGRENLLLTRGDAMTEQDPPVGSGELLGRVAAIERGRRCLQPRPPAGWTLLLARLGRRSSGALLAMAQWHVLRRRAKHRIMRLFPWIAATPQGDGVIEELSA